MFSRRIFVALTAMILFVSACVPFVYPNPPTPADYCLDAQGREGAAATNAVDIEIWATAPRQHCGRAFGPALAAETVADFAIRAKPRAFNLTSSPYLDKLLAAAADGAAPDIAFAYDYHLPALIEADAIVPLQDCRAQYSAFDQIRPEFWTILSPEQQLWGVPLEAGMTVLFFNKPKLRQLGWSEAQIASLPQEIERGAFTLDDMLREAQRAIAQGVVEPGFGFTPRSAKNQTFFQTYIAFGGRLVDAEQDKLMVDRNALAQTYTFQRRLIAENITLENFAGADFNTWGDNVVWRDALSHGRALFWHGYLSDWRRWEMDHIAANEGETYLRDTVGMGLFPSGIAGQPGAVLLSEIGFYVLLSEKAAGHNSREAACALLAASIGPEINIEHSARSMQLSVLQSKLLSADNLGYPMSQAIDMRDFLFARPARHPLYPDYKKILIDTMFQAETGKLTPDAAADAAISQLRRQLGDHIIVE